MTGEAIDTSRSFSKFALWFLCVVWVLVMITAHAGGLGIAPIAAITGGIAFLGLRLREGPTRLRRMPVAISLLLALLLLGYISSIYSPYQSQNWLNNPLKLLIGVPLFLMASAWITSSPQSLRSRLGTFVLGLACVWGVVLCFDLISGFKLTWMVDPPAPGSDFNIKRGDSIQNLSHAVSVAVLLLIPVWAIGWSRGGLWRLLSVGFVAAVMAAGIAADTDANFMAALAAIIVFVIALWRPKPVLALSFSGAAASIAMAPFIAFLASRSSSDFRDNLPFSWAERVENWSYMYGKIMEKPLFGHGFDAVRTFNDTHSIRGFEDRAIVSLHPHNAGLHIWAELGAIGVILVVTIFYLGWKALVSAKLAHMQLASVSGYISAVTIISALSYGVWQDWWWAAVILCSAVIMLIPFQEKKS